MRRSLSVAATLVLAAAPLAQAQQVVGGAGTPFKDTSVITNSVKDAAVGHKVVLLEFEDLECPACAHAAPIVKTAIEHYKVNFQRHDYLIPNHIWSKEAAITARYLQDKVNPDTGEQYRRDVFATQNLLASRDDLANYTKRWFDAHKLPMPFVMDPSGLMAAEVQADVRLGERLGVNETPTIIVAGPKGWIQVKDSAQLYSAIENVQAQVPAATATAHNAMKKPTASNLH